jgi:hypothetical protein
MLGSLVLALALLAVAAAPAAASAEQLRGTVLTPNFQWAPPDGVTLTQSDRETRAACDLGSTVTRVVVNWARLEPGPGQFDPRYIARVDRVVGQLARCDIPVELTIIGTPCWDTTDPLAGSSCTPGAWTLYPPRVVSAYGAVVAWSLLRWGHNLAALEVWNEPNNQAFWVGSVQQYVDLVNSAVDSARAIGSPVPILAGSLAGADVDYLKEMYADGMRGQGGISMHPYTLRPASGTFLDPLRAAASEGPLAKVSILRANIANVHAAMLAAGDPGGIWLTEFGYSVCPATPYCVAARRQAHWIVDSLKVAARIPYVRAAILYSLRDAGNSRDWNNRFGLLRRDFTPRPSYDAVRRVLRGLDGGHWRARRHHR